MEANETERISEEGLTRGEQLYLLRNFVSQCAEYQRIDEIRDLLSNIDYLQDKLDAIGVNSLIRDFDHVKRENYYRQIQNAIEISASTLTVDPSQLGGQLLGRLGEKRVVRDDGLWFKVRKYVQANLSGRIPVSVHQQKPGQHNALIQSIIARGEGPWLQPLFASLNPADSILIRRIRPSIFSGFNDFVLLEDSQTFIAINNSISGGQERQLTLNYGSIETGEIVYRTTLPVSDSYKLTLSPDESRLLIFRDTIFIWDVKNRELVGDYRPPVGFSFVDLKYTTDAKYLVGCDWRGSLWIWNLVDDTGTKIPAHDDKIEDFQITPDNLFVITVGEDKFVRLWSLSTGEKVDEHHRHPDQIRTVQISKNGQWVKTVSDPQLLGDDKDRSCTLYWNLKTRVVTKNGPLNLLYVDEQISQNKNLKFQRKLSGIEVINTHNQKVLGSFRAHASGISKYLLSSDDKYLITLSSDDKNMFVWDVALLSQAPEKQIKEFNQLMPHDREVSAVAISNDGRTGVTASWDGTIVVWNLDAITIRHRLRLLGGRSVFSMAITPDDEIVIAGGDDGAMCGWDLESGQVSCVFGFRPLPQAYKHQERIQTIAVHPNPLVPILASGSGNELLGFMGRSSGELKIWSYQDSSHLADLYQEKELVKKVVFSPDGSICAFGTGQTMGSSDVKANIFLFHLEQSRIDSINLDFTAVGDFVFSTDRNHFGVAQGSLLGPGESKLMALVFNTSSWEIETKCRTEQGQGYIESLLFTKDSRFLIGGLKAGDGNIYIWNLSHNSPPEILPSHTLSGHIGDVNKIFLSQEDKYLISIGDDQTIRVWDLEQKQQIAMFQMESRVIDAALSRDGKTILAGTSDGRVHFFKIHV